MPMQAGSGEHHFYRLATAPGTDQAKLTAGYHYIGIQAVSWFLQKESSWLSDRMASGTLDMSLAGGQEQYRAALGTYELKGGAKCAPVFDRAVLPDRNYRGG